jgi:hypothetical protein
MGAETSHGMFLIKIHGAVNAMNQTKLITPVTN